MCLEFQVLPTNHSSTWDVPSFGVRWRTPALRSQVALDDSDLDALELGGLLTWEEPEDITQVIKYVAWRKSKTGGGHFFEKIGPDF